MKVGEKIKEFFENLRGQEAIGSVKQSRGGNYSLMEIQKVVNHIRACRNDGIKKITITLEPNKSHLILNALEKQIPRRVKSFKKKSKTFYMCGACGREVFSDHDEFCSICGQKLDWRLVSGEDNWS